MPRLEYFVVAEDVAIDQTTNQVSAFNIIEQVNAAAFPVLMPKAAALSLWCREPGEEDADYQVLLRLTLPDGTIHEQPHNFRFRTTRHRVVLRIQGIPIHAPGSLRFELLLNARHAAEHRVDVVLHNDQPDAG